jgi:hypothetical protein
MLSLDSWHRPDTSKSYLKQLPWVVTCERCHVFYAVEGHHCLIHRRNGVSELDLPYNICWLCHECHSGDGVVNSFEFRLWFWKLQVQRYGYREMKNWLDNLPLKIKPNFDAPVSQGGV